MKLINCVKECIRRNRYGKMFLEQYGFKTLVFTLLSIIISVAFAVFNGVIAVMELSVWYGALAAYYIMLIIFRGGVIIADRKCRNSFKDEESLLFAQQKIHLASGAGLLVVEIAMCVAVTQMVMFTPPVKSHMILAIANAAYAFYKITASIINLIKAKRFADPVSQSLRSLNFADACMSMASLTVVLLTTFGNNEGESFFLWMKAGAGFASCVVVLALAAVMIIISLKKLRDKNDGRK